MNWEEFGVFGEVEDQRQKALNTNRVLVQKNNGVKVGL